MTVQGHALAAHKTDACQVPTKDLSQKKWTRRLPTPIVQRFRKVQSPRTPHTQYPLFSDFGNVCGRSGAVLYRRGHRAAQLGKVFALGKSGTIVPLCTSAAAAPWHPSCGAGSASLSGSPKAVKLGGCSPPQLMWEMYHRARGPRFTECHPSAVRSRSRPFAIGGVGGGGRGGIEP